MLVIRTLSVVLAGLLIAALAGTPLAQISGFATDPVRYVSAPVTIDANLWKLISTGPGANQRHTTSYRAMLEDLRRPSSRFADRLLDALHGTDKRMASAIERMITTASASTAWLWIALCVSLAGLGASFRWPNVSRALAVCVLPVSLAALIPFGAATAELGAAMNRSPSSLGGLSWFILIGGAVLLLAAIAPKTLGTRIALAILGNRVTK